MLTRIFVYGTLKRGFCNARHLQEQRFMGDALTAPVYRMVNLGGYPGMFEVSQSGRSICGEVWEVDEACKRQLDELEDVDVGLYTFDPVKLLPPFNDAPVWTYLYAGDASGFPDAGSEFTEGGR